MAAVMIANLNLSKIKVSLMEERKEIEEAFDAYNNLLLSEEARWH